ncbi:formin-like protein 5 [Dorcoceras hygrometricum]|uniref:Formin-like protein 5 n=1 Tax=Dorcoceras hygrometricum TaxID=472368 RepID=A0A2Z7A841_9LAMI|nr:formin-like protein 5 [Dorcoceras hygrometricum]
MRTGIDQLNLHSVQLGYLKILQVGNTDPNNTKAGKQIRGLASTSVSTGTSSQITTPMIALDFSGTTHQSASHNVAFNQVINQSFNQARDISPGMANLKPSLTGYDNSVAKKLKLNFKTEENTYPKAYTNRGTLGKISQKASKEQALRVSSNPRFQSPKWYQSVEKLKRSSAPPISFKTTAGHGGNRRKSATVNSSYRGIRRMEIKDIGLK